MGGLFRTATGKRKRKKYTRNLDGKKGGNQADFYLLNDCGTG